MTSRPVTEEARKLAEQPREFVRYEMVRRGDGGGDKPPRFSIYGFRPNGLRVLVDVLYLRDVPEVDLPWKEAVIDALVCNGLNWDENDPRKCVADLIRWETMLALDPAVSEPAAKMEARAVAAESALSSALERIAELEKREGEARERSEGSEATDHIRHAAEMVPPGEQEGASKDKERGE